MKIKILFLALLFGASFALSSVATAQTSGQAPAMLTPQQRMEKRFEHLKKVLNLTDAQADQLHAIWQQNASKIEADRDAIRAAAPGSDARKAARKQLAADMKALHEQVKSVLTPAQEKKFKQIMLRRVERREKRLNKLEQKLKQ